MSDSIKMMTCKLGECLTVKHGWAFKGEFFQETGKQCILTPGNFYEKVGSNLIVVTNAIIQEIILRNICVKRAI